ncbi:hypothetical protein L3V23_00600 [Vibrio sp. A1-b2]|uniref:hypothetical protein n=1 Tax=Vibrio sp. A1-b2 TaxID=2912248 RepID=UPI001F3DFAD0|nr:hypothetical protein [Vibrio sp. A1-b2]MCF7360594.1 hypothetical protein [Vibrio sp. A1-b2]
MVKLIKHVILINALAMLTVFVLSHYVEQFKTTRFEDFLFYVVVVIWIFAKLLWTGGMHNKNTRIDDAKTDSVYSMVNEHNFEQEEKQHYRQNYQAGFVLFIAGLPALIIALAMHFL